MRMGAVRAAQLGKGRAARTLFGLILSVTVAFGLAPHAAAQSTPYNSLTLLWTAPGDDGNVGQVSSYQLRYSTTPVGTDTTSWWNGIPSSQQLVLGPPLASAGATDSTKVTALSQGTQYYFVLRALDEAGNISGFSNVAVGTTQSCNAPTTTPAPLSAVADTGQVTVTWSSTVDPLAVSLKLYRGQGSGALTLYQTLSPTPSSYVDTSVSPGTTYRYRAAWMGSVCEGPSTSNATATTPGTPPPPPPPPPADAAGSTIHVYPNPASGSVRLAIEVRGSASQTVLVRLFDMNGHWVATLANGTYPAGTNQTTWGRVGRDGHVVAPGYYDLVGTVGSAKVHERLVLIP
jgi:hypothetical protein